MREGGVVLSGHMDVVPADGQKWTVDPFRLTERDGRYFGRGTTDMKGFLAVSLAAAERAAQVNLQRPLHLALSYDEEIGCLGAWDLVAAAKASLPPPLAVIVGEPTSMKIVEAHKGIVTLTTRVIGHSVHSSQMHKGVSATMVAAQLITWLEQRMHELAQDKSPSVFEPPFTTIHCGVVHGGIAANVVAPSCDFVTDIRTIEGIDPTTIELEYRHHVETRVVPRLKAIHEAANVIIDRRSHTPALEKHPTNRASQLASELLGNDGSFHAVAYGSEAGIFQRAGFPTILCGPGNIEQAHKPDEFIEQSELLLARKFTNGIIHQLRTT
jgi:acetylornithine deacetylase